MKIFIPAKKDLNTFFDEITNKSSHEFCYKTIDQFDESFNKILIHWPEQLFGWKEPNDDNISHLTEEINKWKKTATIFYVVHNLQPHRGGSINFQKLYKLIEGSSDVMIHFGRFSLDLMKSKYPEKNHKVILHPLYRTSFKIYSLEYSRRKLGIGNDKTVFLVPGAVRNVEEKKLILRAFKGLKIKNKVLLAPRMKMDNFKLENLKCRYFMKKWFQLDLKKIYGFYLKSRYTNSSYIFDMGFQSKDNLALMLSASNVILIPRLRSLNSGLIFLGLTFNKIVLGPNCGNIKELLMKIKMPCFDPQDDFSILNAMDKAIEINKKGKYYYPDNIKNQFEPENIAKKWDEVLDEN